MADIYLSYSKWDRARVAPLIALLEREGWSVWRDTRVGTGEPQDDAWDENATGQAAAAACVVVVWSVSAIDSDLVRAEARAGFERGILVPVLIEQATPPHLFTEIPTADLSGWKGDPDAPEARTLVGFVRRTAGVPGLWAAAKTARGAPEIEHWESVQNSRSPADFEHFLSQHPAGPLADPARARLGQLQLYDGALMRPAASGSTGRLWLLAAALLAVAGAATWYALDPRLVMPAIEIPAVTEAPPQIAPYPEPAAPEPPASEPPVADVTPSSPEPAQPQPENPDVYQPFGEKTKNCPSDAFACKSTPGCVWWEAFNICVVQEPVADTPPPEATPSLPQPSVPQCPADEFSCRITSDCEWVDHFKACLPRAPETTEAPTDQPAEPAQCSGITDQEACSMDAACEWIVDQCYEKLPAPQ